MSACSRRVLIEDSLVQDVLSRRGPPIGDAMFPTFTYGVISRGPSLLKLCWSGQLPVFTVGSQASTSLKDPSSEATTCYAHGRVPLSILGTKPVDVLVIDHSHEVFDRSRPRDPQAPLPVWFRWLERCPSNKRPRIVVQSWNTSHFWDDTGPAAKSARKAWDRLGYTTRFRVYSGKDHGSPVDQSRLMIISYARIGSSGQGSFSSVTDAWEPTVTPMGPRAMSNCLRPTGAGPHRDDLPDHMSNSVPPLSTRDPMPSKSGRWIQTPLGYRRLHADELAKGLGVPKAWIAEDGRVARTDVDHLTSLHLWEGLSESIRPLLERLHPSTASPPSTDSVQVPTAAVATPISSDAEF